MKVALISEHASPLALLGGVDSGGQNVYVAQMARHLAMLGHEVDVFTRRDSLSQPEVYHWQPGVRVIHVPAGPAEYVPKEYLLDYMDAFSDYMVEFCSDEEYDIVHANFWMSGLAALNIREELGVPFVITFHALGKIRRLFQKEADGFPEERLDIEEEIVRQADAIVAECPQDRLDLINFYNAQEHKIVTIPCGYDPQEFQPVGREAARHRLGLPARDKIVLQLGRMVRRKGVDTVIEAMGYLVHYLQQPATLLIVGGNSDDPDPQLTPEIGRLRALAQEAGVADQVIFAGRKSRPELKYYYSASDVFVTTPWYEPFGITPLEAMACGTPVIGASVGGIKYTVQDTLTGFLVAPRDPIALAHRLDDVLANPALAGTLGENCLRHARQFVWAQIALLTDRLYTKVQVMRYAYASGLS